MKLEVRYFSKSGNTKKLAEVIAEEAGCKAQDISVPLDGYADILFLGAAVYGGGISSKMKEYIQALDKDKIGKVAVFSTSALSERAFPQIRQELEGKGIAFFEKDFYCRGQFLTFHRGRPNDDDKEAARKYAADILSSTDMERK